MRCAIIEAETREEVMREMETRMKKMEEIYTRRSMKEVRWIALVSRTILETVIGSLVGAERTEDRCKDRYAPSIWAVREPRENTSPQTSSPSF